MPPLPGSPAWQRDSSHSTVLDYHLSMLHDTARMDSFRRAINASVQPGDVVVDIGCGSGVLSFMACEAGAREGLRHRRWAGHRGRPGAGHRQRVRRPDRVPRVVGRLEVGIPEPADVLISETIGNAGFDEGIVAWTFDARQRLLRPGAVLAAPATPHVGRRRGIVRRSRSGVGLAGRRVFPTTTPAAHRRAAQTLWFADFTPSNLLGQPELAADVDLTDRSQRDDHLRGHPPGGP